MRKQRPHRIGPRQIVCLMALTACAGPRPANGTDADPPSLGAPAVIEQIREIADATNTEIEEGRATRAVFWKHSSREGEHEHEPSWQRGGPEDVAGEHRVVAQVYEIRGSVAKVVIDTRSPSEDWVNTTEYYFYPSGRTALRFECHFTFNGLSDDDYVEPSFAAERRSYFDEEGRVVRKRESAVDKTTHLEVPVDQVQDIDLDVYPSVAALPFARLLK